MQSLSRSEVKQKLESNGVTVIDVLSPAAYADFHLPRARNVPLGDDFDRQIAQAVPDKSQPVILYCMDTDCQASSKAAARMEELGYEQVFDYEAGKVDWKEAGLPIEHGSV